MTNIRIHIIKGIRYVGNSQTMFAPTMQNGDEDVFFTYGINGSIRKRYDHQTQNTDYYYFNASGNLKACGTDMQISVYGYNSANTRTYKVNMFNANQWVNGQPQPIQPMVQNAMFYPNTYLNFTQAGEYTKHYYNGTERICSRLGEQQIPISVENDQELLNYQHDTKEILRNAIGQHLYDAPTDMQEGDLIPLEFLQETGNNNAIFYYHPNHLSSTMYVTDAQQSVVQSFLYAPYGDIISEYNPGFNGNVLPNYAFNAKELDEETGMYYYEARYYKPPVFTSRDPMMDQKPWLSPYHYCSNNPVGRVDPSGMLDEDNPVFSKDGKLLGTDSRGWKGMPIVMDENDYHKNMDGKAAVKARKAIPLDEYGEGISISKNSWKKIVSNGGEEQTPYVRNKSSKTIYYKPEKTIRNYENDGAYPIEAGKDLYMPVDGVATSKYSDNVGKIPTKSSVTITKEGGLDIDFWGFGGLIRLFPDYGWVDTNWLKQKQKGGDNSWNKLFEKAKKIGRRSY